MNLLPTPEQAEIISVIGDFLANEVPIRRYQEPSNLGVSYPSELWQQFVELGWFGVSRPESQGGSGMGIAGEILLAREAGRQLISPTILATTYAVTLTARHNVNSLTTELIAGQKRVALALTSTDETFLLFDSKGADFALTLKGGCLQLFNMSSINLAGDLKSTDESLGISRASLMGNPILASKDDADVMHLAIILCAALSGIAESACTSAVDYANEREQFGKPIGSFQSINHLCADMAVRNEAAWAQCVYAALCLEAEHTDASKQVAAAVESATKAAIENARSNVQVHGGVGFTTEYDAHLLVKRSHVLSNMLGALIDRRALLLA